MEYKLSLLQTLQAMLIWDNMPTTALAILFQVLLPMLLFILLKKYRLARNIVVGLYVGAIVVLLLYPIWGSGWRINGDKLNMQAYGFSADISIPAMEIGMVPTDGEWEIVIMENGAALPALFEGKFRLANKKSVLAFDYGNQEKRLFIAANNKYYLIAYPETTALYKELIKLGAKEKKFTNIK